MNLIKQKREALKMRQEDLAELSHAGLKTIHMIEQGKANPSFKTLEKVAGVVGLEISLQIKQIDHGESRSV